jgi:hypothetical protein
MDEYVEEKPPLNSTRQPYSVKTVISNEVEVRVQFEIVVNNSNISRFGSDTQCVL